MLRVFPEFAQISRLDDAARVLARKIEPFPRLVIDASGMESGSPKNWFQIRDLVSGKYFRVRGMRATDFYTRKFENILDQFLLECE